MFLSLKRFFHHLTLLAPMRVSPHARWSHTWISDVRISCLTEIISLHISRRTCSSQPFSHTAMRTHDGSLWHDFHPIVRKEMGLDKGITHCNKLAFVCNCMVIMTLVQPLYISMLHYQNCFSLVKDFSFSSASMHDWENS
jgi:hypothetical protein